MIKDVLGQIVAAIRRAFPPLPEPMFMSDNDRYSAHEIGEWTYGNPRVVFEDSGARLRIGRFCSIAEGVVIFLGGEHQTRLVTTYPLDICFPEWTKSFDSVHGGTKGDVRIGNDVWIGKDAIILSGVTIGNGAVVGAGSVLTTGVEPYSIVAGNPARHVRYRFPKSTIEALQDIAWWDWPQDRIEEARSLLLSAQVDEFIAKYARGRGAQGTQAMMSLEGEKPIPLPKPAGTAP